MSLPVPGLGAGSTHGLLGEEFSIDANGIPLTFATEAGAPRCVRAFRSPLRLYLYLRLSLSLPLPLSLSLSLLLSPPPLLLCL